MKTAPQARELPAELGPSCASVPGGESTRPTPSGTQDTGLAWPEWNRQTITDIRGVVDPLARLTGLAFSVADSHINYFLRSDNEHFCMSFAHQQCPGLKAKCERCDRQFVETMLRGGQPFAIHDCDLLGLKDFFVPVRLNGRVLLYIVGGAVLSDESRVVEVCDRLMAAGCSLPRPELAAEVRKRLPVVGAAQVERALEMTRAAAALIERNTEVRWEKAKLKQVTRIDALGRQLLGDLDSSQKNPLEAMRELAVFLTQAVEADACCVWKSDVAKNRIFSLITSGFAEKDVLRLSALEPEQSLLGGVIRDGKREILASIATSDRGSALPLRKILLDAGCHALMCVPVRTADEIPGAVSVYRRSTLPFGNEHAELLEELVPHVWQAISKAEVSRHALAQAQITRLLNVDLDSDGLYDQLAQEILTWVGARGCSVFFRRGKTDKFDLRGTTGIKGGSQNKVYEKGHGLTGWVAGRGRPLRIYDCRDSSEIAAIDPGLHWSAEVVEAVEEDLAEEAIRSFLAVPITVAGEVCGVIRVYVASFGRSAFSPEDERLLTVIAHELGEAWKRFRLAEEVQRISRHTKAVLDDVLAVHQAVVQQATTGQESPKDVVRLSFERIEKHHPTWEWINLRIPDEKEEALRFYYLTGPGKENAAPLSFALRAAASLGADSYLRQQEIYVGDISQEPRYACPYGDFGARSCFMLPMIVSGRCVGVLTVDSTVLDDFDERGKEYLRLVAVQLATAFSLSNAIDGLRRADEEKQAHLEAMAHQLVAPLFALRTNCENLLEGRLTAERGRKVLVSVAAQSRIAARTASNFGILADILLKRLPGKVVRRCRRDAARLVVELARDYQPMAWANGKEITVNCRGFREVHAYYDTRTFPQALGNIIENAVKYSDDFTPITIQVTVVGGKVQIEVTSQGVVLLPEDVERVFERGFRSQAARRRYPPGTGIGLSISRAILEAHGGRVLAMPTDHQKRTTFVIELPSE